MRCFDEHAVARLQQLRQCREQRVERVKRCDRNGRVRRGGADGDVFRQLPAGNDERHAGFGRADAGLAMQGISVGTELAHVAEDGHPAAGRKRRHGAQRRRRGIGIGVIAVVNDRIARRAHDARAAADRPIGRDAADDLLVRQAVFDADGRALERRINHVLPVGGDAHRDAPRARDDRAGAALIAEVAHIDRAHVTAGREAERHLALAAGHGAQQVVVPVAEGDGVVRHGVEHGGLFLQDAAAITQELQMRVADDRKEHGRRLHHSGQRRHIAEVRHAHLDDRSLMLRLEPEERERHAELIVEILFGFQRVPALREHGRDHFLGRRLADAAGHAEDRDGKAGAVGTRERLERGGRVRHADDRAGLPRRDTLRKAAGRTEVERPADVVVPVHPLAGDGGKERAGRDGAAVDDDAGHRRCPVTREHAAGDGGDVRYTVARHRLTCAARRQ